MSTHRVVIDLPDDVYRILRASVDGGDFPSESEAIAGLIPGLLLDEVPEPGDPAYQDHESWLQQELHIACQQADANPDAFFTLDQLQAHLKADREASEAGE